MMKEPINQEDITILNVYVSNNRAREYREQVKVTMKWIMGSITYPTDWQNYKF